MTRTDWFASTVSWQSCFEHSLLAHNRSHRSEKCQFYSRTELQRCGVPNSPQDQLVRCSSPAEPSPVRLLFDTQIHLHVTQICFQSRIIFICLGNAAHRGRGWMLRYVGGWENARARRERNYCSSVRGNSSCYSRSIEGRRLGSCLHVKHFTTVASK